MGGDWALQVGSHPRALPWIIRPGTLPGDWDGLKVPVLRSNVFTQISPPITWASCPDSEVACRFRCSVTHLTEKKTTGGQFEPCKISILDSKL